MNLYLILVAITTIMLIIISINDKKTESSVLFLRSFSGGILFPFVWAGLVLLSVAYLSSLVIDKIRGDL